MERLSSSLTFFWKYIFSPLWCVGFGLGALSLFTGTATGSHDLRWFFLVGWFVGTAIVWLMAGRLKRVDLDGDHLVISNYLREARVPVHEIVAADQQGWDSTRVVVVRFANRTPFGRSIAFSPVSPRPLRELHPVVARLRGLAAQAHRPSA